MILETLAGWGLNKIKDLVFKKGEDFVNDKLGINLTELITKGEEGKLKLQSIELEKQKELNGLMKAGFNRIGIGRDFIHADCDKEKAPDVIWTYYK